MSTDISEELVETAYQLAFYFQLHPNYAVNSGVLRAVCWVHETQPQPGIYRELWQAFQDLTRTSQRRSTRSEASPTITEDQIYSQTVNLPFPQDWATDPVAVRQATSRLVKATSTSIPFNFVANRAGLTPAPTEHHSREPESTPLRTAQPLPSTAEVENETRHLPSPQSTSEMADPSASRSATGTRRQTSSIPRTSIENDPQTENTTSRGLSQHEMQQIATIVAQVFQNIPTERRPPSRSAESSTSTSTSTSTSSAAAQTAFNPKLVGFLDPNPNKPSVEVKDNYNVFHNVFSFTQKLRVRATTPSATPLQQNVENCLLGSAERWFTEELNDLSRTGLRFSPGIQVWCSTSESRF